MGGVQKKPKDIGGIEVIRKRFLAVIPARKGSKRLPNKNVLEIGGKPLVAWTIEAALRSKYIKEIVVSSDDERVLDIANRYCVRTLRRPYELATDSAKTIDAVKHVLENIEECFDYVVLLQPTSPLRNEKHIDAAIELLNDKQADAVVSVREMKHPPLWCNTLPENKSMEGFLREEIKNSRSQDLPKFYCLNGAIYICKTDRLIEENTFFIRNNIYAYVMDEISSVDIDEYIDYLFVKFIIENEFHKSQSFE